MHSRWLRDLRGSAAASRCVVSAEMEQIESAVTNRAGTALAPVLFVPDGPSEWP